MTTTRLYPGMCDGSLEIFYIPEEDRLMAIKDRRVRDYEELPDSDLVFLDEIIESEPEVRSILQSWASTYDEQRRKLAECRFGGLNFQPDFRNKVASPDSFNCPVKASCSGFGIVCKAIEYNGVSLNDHDTEAIKLLVSSKKNTVIAELLSMPTGSFEVYRTKLYTSLKVSTKQELARVAFDLGLV